MEEEGGKTILAFLKPTTLLAMLNTLQPMARWKREYGGLRVDQAKRLKELEPEHVRLRRVVANQALDRSILKEVASGNF